MAQADIDGFRISIDAQLANDLSKVDKALAGIAASGGAASSALSSFAKSVNEINLDASKMSSLKNAIEGIKTALAGMNTDTLKSMSSNIDAISRNISTMQSEKLRTLFADAESPAQKIYSLVNNMATVFQGLTSGSLKQALTDATQASVTLKNAQTGVNTTAPITTKFDPTELSKTAHDLSTTLNEFLKEHPIQVKLKKPTAENMAEFDAVRKDLEAKFKNLQVTLATSVVKSVTQGTSSATQQATKVAQQSADSTQEALSESKINALWTERARLTKEIEQSFFRIVQAQNEGKAVSETEVQLYFQKYERLQGIINQLYRQKQVNQEVYNATAQKGEIKVNQAVVDAANWVAKEREKIAKREAENERRINDELLNHLIENYKRQKAERDKYAQQVAKQTSAYSNERQGVYEGLWGLGSSSGAIYNAQQAKTLQELQFAYKNLQSVMSKTDPKSAEWNNLNKVYQDTKKRIDGIKKSMDGMKSSSQSLLPTLNNLAMQLGIVFSVQQLGQWVKHMTEVRAQFELQQIALRSIIQDKQKADEVFAQVQQLALKSPFSIMQLNTYTKQIAAYGVEAEKLVGTTKMLADVSAGLGVDMGRLILAYGQVKTANFLRATEVRQFTEAGLNITQELANYFTELNGKMVTAGEVTEMITKRMVKFEDVAEVFKRVTSAGGMFYDMQEKQAEGLHGQMQRIGDAYAMMLNDIGKSNEGTIASVLATIRELIQNWRVVLPLVESIVKSVAFFYTTKGIIGLIPLLKNLGSGVSLIISEMRTATGVLATFRAGLTATNTVIGTMGWVSLATAIGGLIYTLYSASNATSQLAEDLERMQKEAFSDATDAVARYKDLADTVRDVTKSYSERKDAMDEIQRAYGYILPKQQLELDGIMSINDGYKNATETIREYYRLKLEEEQKSAIDSSYAQKFSTEKSRISDVYTDMLAKYGASKSSIQGILNEIQKDWQDGMYKSATLAGQAFVKRLGEYYNVSGNKQVMNALNEALYGGNDNFILFEEFGRQMDAYKNRLASITTEVNSFSNVTDEKATEALRNFHKQLDENIQKLDVLKMSFSQLDNLRTLNERAGGTGFDIAKIQTAVSDGKTGDLTEEEQKVAAALQEIDKALASVGMTGKYTWQQIYDATANNLAQMDWLGTVQKTVLTDFKNNLGTAKDEANKLAKTKFTEELQAKIDGIDGSPAVREIRRIVKAVADANKLDYHLFDWLTLDVKTSFESAGKEFDTQLKAFQQKIHAYKEMMKTMYVTGQSEQDILNVLGLSKEQVKNSDAIIKTDQQIKTALGNVDKEKKSKKSGTDKTEQTLRERIQLLKEANQTYEKYAKEYDKVIAKQKTHNDLMERAKELKIDEIFKAEDLTNTATLDAMRQVYEKFKSLYENKKYVGAKRDALKSMSEMEFEIGVEINKQSREDIKRQLDDMMGGYQLVMELDKSGVDTNLAQSLFDVDYTSLDEVQARWEEIFLDSINKQYAQMDKSFVAFKSYEEAKQKLSEQTDNENFKIAIDAEKKITDAQKKEYESRMKEYTKYLKKSYSESVNVQVEAYSKLSQIQRDFQTQSDAIDKNDKYTDEQKAEMKANLDASLRQITDSINKEMKEKLGKVMFETFKSSDVYTEMFGDLSKVGRKTIDVLIGKINELKGHMEQLSPKQIKELAQYEEKLFEAKAERDPFGEYLKALKEVNALRKQGLTYDKIDQSIAISQGKVDDYQAEIDSLNIILAAKQKNLESEIDTAQLTESSKDALDATIPDLQTRIKLTQAAKKAEEDNLQTLQNQQGSCKRLLSTTEKTAKAVQEWGELGKKASSLIRKGMEAIGGELDEEQAAYFDIVDALIECGVQAATFALQMEAVGVASKEALGVIGYILIALEAVVSVISAIAGAKDAKLKKRIEEHKRAIDSLKESYDNLSDSISNAFAQVQYASDTREMQRNLEEQNKHLSEMIAVEKDRKKADKDQIADWEKQIRDNIKEMKQKEAEFINELGGLGTGADVRESAQNFVDAWFDAFNETGNGLSGLTDEFDDFIRNIVKKQAYMTVASHWIDKFADMINNAFNQETGTVNYDKMREAMNWMTTDGLPQMDSFLEDFAEYFEQMGVSWNNSSSKLSGLAQGIQGVTEETAQIVEALLNSMRYYVADTNAQLRQMVTSFINPPSDNVFLTEMRAQTNELRSIHSTLKGLIKGGHPRGGSGVKVFTS